MTPEQAKAHLRKHAVWLRDEIGRCKIEPEIERLEYVATAIEQFLDGRAKSLDRAFDVKRGRGNPGKHDEHRAIAEQVYPLWRKGLEWPEILSQLGVPAHGDDSKIRRAFAECLGELFQEELAGRLAASRHLEPGARQDQSQSPDGA